MSDVKQGLRKSTLSLVAETEEIHDFHVVEAQKASDEQAVLKERGKILEAAKIKTNSVGARTIIQTMISEIQEMIILEEQRQRESENNKKFYAEVNRALNAAIKEF